MSSRVLRKLHGDRNLNIPIPDVASADDSDEDIQVAAENSKTFSQNPFDLLNDGSNSPVQSEEPIEEDQESEAQVENNFSNLSKDSKARKKKKKKSNKQQHKTRHSRDEEEDEVESCVREVNRLLGEAVPLPSTSRDAQKPLFIAHDDLLKIERKYLNPNNEMNRMFGSKTLKTIQSETRKRRSRHTRKPALLVPHKDTWPRVGNQGLSMKLVGERQGFTYFEFQHSPAYQAVEKKFLAALDSLHPDNIVAIINLHPYHVNALLQMSDIFRISEDLAVAADLVEMALFALENAFHTSFNITQGTCRMDYRMQLNRPFFIAIFKHILYLGGRACHRTALEFCKLLLSLDPDVDPLAVVLLVDFYALRTREYKWLVDFFQKWETKRNLSQLPNFAFSIAIAHFHLLRQKQSEERKNDTSSADLLLQDALIMFPSALQQILDKCSVRIDARVSSHTYFTANASKNQSPALEQLIKLYVSQGYRIWKDNGLLFWLERNVHAVLDRVDSKDPAILEAESKRARRYLGTLPRPILRHIALRDLKDITLPELPEQHGSILALDPLPPLDSIDFYKRSEAERTHEARVARESNALLNFFRSMVPAFNDLEMNSIANAVDAVPEENHDQREAFLQSFVARLENLFAGSEDSDIESSESSDSGDYGPPTLLRDDNDDGDDNDA